MVRKTKSQKLLGQRKKREVGAFAPAGHGNEKQETTKRGRDGKITVYTQGPQEVYTKKTGLKESSREGGTPGENFPGLRNPFLSKSLEKGKKKRITKKRSEAL